MLSSSFIPITNPNMPFSSTPTVYLVTGVNRGIGESLVKALLLRPDTTVIGTVRNAKQAAHLHQLTSAKGSQLILVEMEASRPDTIIKAIAGLELDRVDVVIANAGSE
jgi:norsolorinic acid ketoreductase